MLDQLNLTADQKPKVQSIYAAQRQKMRDLRQDTSLTPEDRSARMKALHDDMATQMKAVLTPEQFDKWQKMPQPGMRDRRNGPPPGGETAKGTNVPLPRRNHNLWVTYINTGRPCAVPFCFRAQIPLSKVACACILAIALRE